MKFFLKLFTLVISFFLLVWLLSVNAKCEFSDVWSVTWMVEGCMNDTTVVAVKWTWLVEDGFKTKISSWTNNIALFLALLSVGSVIYGGLMMTLSAWEDEKIKKAKDIVKWSLIGFLWVVLATTIVTLVINVIYWLSPA